MKQLPKTEMILRLCEEGVFYNDNLGRCYIDFLYRTIYLSDDDKMNIFRINASTVKTFVDFINTRTYLRHRI